MSFPLAGVNTLWTWAESPSCTKSRSESPPARSVDPETDTSRLAADQLGFVQLQQSRTPGKPFALSSESLGTPRPHRLGDPACQRGVRLWAHSMPQISNRLR